MLWRDARWSNAYTRGVLSIWKQRRAYCNAVLRYDLRQDLDGAPTVAVVGQAAGPWRSWTPSMPRS